MEQVLVTGGAGFIGANLVQMLVKEYGCKVTVLDNLRTGCRQNLEEQEVIQKIEFIKGSVLDSALLEKVMSGKDTVFHLAAVPMLPSTENPESSLETNTLGTFRVLQAALQAGCKKFVYGSTSSVYGNPVSLPAKEEDKVQLLSFYAVSKYAGEGYAQVFQEQYGLPLTIVRYSNVYGPKQRVENPYTGVVAKFINWALQDQPLRIHGEGTQTRDFTFIQDACRATILAALSPKAVGEVFNIGTGVETAVNDLAHLVIKLTGSQSVLSYEKERSIDNIYRRVLKIEKAGKELHFSPEWTLAAGLQETITWLQK